MNLIRKISNNIFNVKILILLLIIIIFISNYQESKASTTIKDPTGFIYTTIYTPEELRSNAVASTKTLTGVAYDNGIKIYDDTEFGNVYNKTPEGASSEKLKSELISLYNIVLPLEEQQWIAINERNKLSGTYENRDSPEYKKYELQRLNLESQIQTAIVDFKKNVGWGTTYNEARVTAANKGSQAIQQQIIYCWGGVTVGFSIPGCIAISSYFVLYLTSWVLYVAALAFDWTIQWSLSMYDIVDSFKAIQYGWETLRNVINLFFILILVFISIATILRIENYGYKKLLSKLVIAAFLINFSMFFTKIIIDVSNITAIVFYKQIMVDAEQAAKAGSGGAPLSGAAAGKTNQYLSLGIMNALGLQSIWGVVNTNGGAGSMGSSSSASNDPAVNSGKSIAAAGGATTATDPWTMTLIGLGGSVFILILSFVFFSATIMLLLRIIVLIILIITSPAAFAARVLPQTSKWSDKWWSHLINNALFAPVYMILMFVTLKMIWSGSNQAGAGGNLLSIFSNTSGGAIESVVFFILLCAMLVACLFVASSFGTMGSKTMQGWGKSLGNSAKNYTKSRAFAPVSYVADKASKNKYVGKLVGGMGLQGLDKLAQAKVGGSSYRSRVADDQKMYKTRGDLIKKANIGELIRGRDESAESFKNRKEEAEKAGKEAERAYYGVNADGDAVTSRAWNKGKQQARQDVLDSAKKSREDPSGKIVARSNENIVKVMNGDFKNALGALKDSERDEIENLIKATHVYEKDATGAITTTLNSKATAKAMTPEKVFEIVSKISRPLEELNKEIAVLDKEMGSVAKKLRTGAGGPGSREKDRMALIAIQSQIDSKNRKVGAINSAVARLEADANRVQDTNAQSKTRDAIEKSKPEPAK